MRSKKIELKAFKKGILRYSCVIINLATQFSRNTSVLFRLNEITCKHVESCFALNLSVAVTKAIGNPISFYNVSV